MRTILLGLLLISFVGCQSPSKYIPPKTQPITVPMPSAMAKDKPKSATPAATSSTIQPVGATTLPTPQPITVPADPKPLPSASAPIVTVPPSGMMPPTTMTPDKPITVAPPVIAPPNFDSMPDFVKPKMPD